MKQPKLTIQECNEYLAQKMFGLVDGVDFNCETECNCKGCRGVSEYDNDCVCYEVDVPDYTQKMQTVMEKLHRDPRVNRLTISHCGRFAIWLHNGQKIQAVSDTIGVAVVYAAVLFLDGGT